MRDRKTRRRSDARNQNERSAEIATETTIEKGIRTLSVADIAHLDHLRASSVVSSATVFLIHLVAAIVTARIETVTSITVVTTALLRPAI
jgi:hypothetical protein